jgi:Domain of unknown function (DUF4412)
MRNLRALPAIALIVPLVGSQSWAAEKPQLIPTRDVDITYNVNRPGEATVRERVRWLASDHLERIDGPKKSTTIIDQKANEVTLLNYTSGTYSQTHVDGASPWPVAPPDEFAIVKRRGESVVAGLRCRNWSWTDNVEARVACITADGVVLRLVTDGETRVEAQSVSYGAQDADIFLIPPGYAPAVMAPELHRLIR